MKKEELIKLGLTEELAEKVATASAEELKTYIPKSRFDEVNEAKKTAEENVKTRDKQISDLKKATGDNEELKQKFEDLQKENKQASKDYEAKIKQMERDSIDKELLSTSRNLKATKALLGDLDESLDAEAYKTLRSEEIKALQESEDTKFLFGEGTKFNGAEPGESGDGNPEDKPDTTGWTYEQYAAHLENNPDAEI